MSTFAPRAFISYSHDSSVHSGRVRELADHLRRDGIDAVIDQYEVSPPEGWPYWTARQIEEADFVLVVCSELYEQRFQETGGRDRWEGAILTRSLYEAAAGNRRIVPVVLTGSDTAHVPGVLRDYTRYDVSREEGYEALYRHLTSQPLVSPPALGERRAAADLGLPPPAVPEPLVEACAHGECVLYAGAGLSSQAGLPTWRPLLEELLESCRQRHMADPELLSSLEAGLSEGDLDSVADSLVNALKSRKDELLELLGGIFLEPAPTLPVAHRKLRAIPFAAALTTNFDHLLERTWADRQPPVYTHRDTEALLDALAEQSFFLLKLYGDLTRPETVLLAPGEFERSVASNLAFSQFMESLFYSRTLLFVGASPEGIEAYLDGITFREPEIPPRHYALVAVTSAAWKTQADVLKRRYGIQVIPYQGTSGYPQLGEFLERLERAVAARPTPVALDVGFPRWDRPLTRVRLENIGPFDELELNLESGWTVLLGDNGVGKSSLLRAIALAICGEDAVPYAGRLLRGREPNGSIVLDFAGHLYTTRIFRRSTGVNGRAEVNSIPTRPLETENRLSLGFPPLRTVSWERVERVEWGARAMRPEVEDLLPLVSGAPDPRLDKLKQIILKLDHQAKEEAATGGRPGRQTGVIHKIFEVVDQLTEGLRVRFAEVTAETGEVWVETDDGRQRLEAVSQGTVSLLSWIGVLLQRLYQINGEQEDWARKSALVLMDEIDAHMHPEWKRKLIPKLRQLFPEVQFIATSHSPLLASGLEASEVRVMRRETGSRRIGICEPRLELRGLRADQILTSPLFHLATTRDPATERLVERYRELTERTHASAGEARELELIAAQLRTRPPSAAERGEAREAFRRIEDAVLEKLHSVSEEERSKLLREVQWQIRQGLASSSGIP